MNLFRIYSKTVARTQPLKAGGSWNTTRWNIAEVCRKRQKCQNGRSKSFWPVSLISTELSVTNLFLWNKQSAKHSISMFWNVHGDALVKKRPDLWPDKWIFLRHYAFPQSSLGRDFRQQNKCQCWNIHYTRLIFSHVILFSPIMFLQLKIYLKGSHIESLEDQRTSGKWLPTKFSGIAKTVTWAYKKWESEYFESDHTHYGLVTCQQNQTSYFAVRPLLLFIGYIRQSLPDRRLTNTRWVLYYLLSFTNFFTYRNV